MAERIDLPSDGRFTRAEFEGLPRPPRRWAWELRGGRLRIEHTPLTGWHSLALFAAIRHWDERGYPAVGNQYVADGAFMRGEDATHILVAEGVAFAAGHRIDLHADTHDAAHVHAVVDIGLAAGREHDAAQRRVAFAQMGVPHYWVVPADWPGDGQDELIATFELVDGEYRLAGHRLVSQLGSPGEAGGGSVHPVDVE
jgi:Putative restriction endonuclease